MFDDPKKELERLQEQLLAAEARNEEDFEEISEEYYEDEEDELYDEELDAIVTGRAPRLRRHADSGRDVSGRATGFDADDYEMDTDRYVPSPKKKGIGCLAAFGIFQAIAVIALIGWLLWRMS